MAKIGNRRNQLIELKHIQLELKARRTRHFRHFIDQYFCYGDNRYLTKNGLPKWEAIVWNEYVSNEALRASNGEDVTQDYVVPLKVISKMLFDLGDDLGIADIEGILSHYLKFATITKEEDKELNKRGLKSSMPEGFSIKGDPLHDDPFARYTDAGIEYKKVGE